MELNKINDYMLIAQAADYLGVNKNTLRRWDRDGKLVSYRNPISRFRCYLKDDLDKFLQSIGGNK